MKIKRISLTNFRSFKGTQSIDIAPVTLLFGPNSVGKSSVLIALAYIQQVLEKGHCDPQRLDSLGDKMIGGFRSLVHGGDLNRTICIKLDFELGNTIYRSDGDDYGYLGNIFNAVPLELEDFGGSVERFSLELEIAWSYEMDWAFVKNYRVWINDLYLGCVNSSEDLKDTSIVDLNLHHPLAVTGLDYSLPDLNADEIDEFEAGKLSEHTSLGATLDSLVPGRSRKVQSHETEADESYQPYHNDIGVACHWGAIPVEGDSLSTNLKYSDLEPDQNHLDYLIANNFLTLAFLEPIALTKRFLRSYIAIGPVRVIPDFDYVPNPNPEQKDWSDGRAGWDILYRNPHVSESTAALIKHCNSWLRDEDKLNSGYELKNWSLFETTQGSTGYDESHYLLRKRHLLFNEIGKYYPLSASQLGTGISQVLPVLVAAHQDGIEFISVEQPELHLHPRVQVELGDLFLSCSKDRAFLVETHSEHLILRLLKRIRQTTDKELPAKYQPIEEDDISIVYLEPTENGVVTKRIRVDEDGEFVDRWPQGFFVERREELL